MKFVLKDYQNEAVRETLINLSKARRRWHEEGDKHAFSLTATTGAGKTVMAAAVFEALFYGDSEFNFESDRGAVVIWFSDDPSLNQQTRFRLLESSNRLVFTDLVVVENNFVSEKFDARKIYFLNTQKLSKKSLLVRGLIEEDSDAAETVFSTEIRPDRRQHTIWDTIKNTIEDRSLTLYLVLDEAHRGMGRNTSGEQKDKSTIVRRLINGTHLVPAIPVVWGISATVERFNTAMIGAEGRSTLPNVVVESSKVQESGLLKDTIVLDVPQGTGQFDTLLMRRATDKIKELSLAWEVFANENDEKSVSPLMVLQVPNNPDSREIGRLLDTIFGQWSELSENSVAHVLADHSIQSFGRHNVPYISPERVQDSTWIRILVAKDAISTGWDCPRAEVMVSFRPATDRTHITQLLGRMVRTPLAKRIPGNDRLNSVDCLLPFFDITSVEHVLDVLMKGGVDDRDTPLVGRQVLINPREMTQNMAIESEVWEKYLSLPSQFPPRKESKPIKRLTALAQELSSDSLLSDAVKKAHRELHKELDACQARFVEEISEAMIGLLNVEGKTLIADLSDRKLFFGEFWEKADTAVILAAYRKSSRLLGSDVCRTYADHLATQDNLAVSREDALVDAYATIAALGMVPDVKTSLENVAVRLTLRWLDEFRVAFKNLADDRQDAYRQIKSMSTKPVDIDLARPISWIQPTSKRHADGDITLLPCYEHHLLCDEDGNFPASLNTWEVRVVKIEMDRPGFCAWYRNPSRTGYDSLSVAYTQNGETKVFRPDFIFFSRKANGTIVADIVDPHGPHLSDSLPKLVGLANYAQKHSSVFRRIDAVALIGNVLRVLDLKDPDVRGQVSEAKDAKSLYSSSVANEYLSVSQGVDAKN